ncbi:MAG: protein kinase [Oscillatoria sp. SIO1A7]|nr:protein kinase [Oscillatoria sp. SIO1A7]
MLWEPGQKLQGGRYVIEKKLRPGGFGATYLARDERGNAVAIKTANEKVQQRRDFAKCQQDFLNEVLCLAKCSHPHIVRANELIYEEPLWCLVMEYIEGSNLDRLVENEGFLPEAEALRYIRQIGSAIALVHERGLLHRDIKPLNILLRCESEEEEARRSLQAEAVLIDFGLARSFSQNSAQVQEPYISKGYAPIEQYDKRALRGTYTDVYALAATLYSLLTATTPEPAKLRDRSWAKEQKDSLVPPQQINIDISDRVSSAILKGMAIEPEHRPQTVADWLQLLDISRACIAHHANPEINLETNPEINPELNPNLAEEAAPETDNSRLWSSAVGMDYSKLRDLLELGQWQEADRETAAIMLAVWGKEKDGRLRGAEVKDFPCRDLRAIDRLWLEYSNDRFGFSVQNRIWRNLDKDYEQFGDAIGWRVGNSWLPYSELTFDTSAPEGHLPSWGRRGRLWSLLGSRVKNCGL